jgi:hypothetical protein
VFGGLLKRQIVGAHNLDPRIFELDRCISRILLSESGRTERNRQKPEFSHVRSSILAGPKRAGKRRNAGRSSCSCRGRYHSLNTSSSLSTPWDWWMVKRGRFRR